MCCYFNYRRSADARKIWRYPGVPIPSRLSHKYRVK